MASVEVEGAVTIGTLTLNRPDRLNAFNADMVEQFDAGLKALVNDPAVRCILIRGAGRAFSVGNDVARGGSGYEGAKPEYDPVKDSMRIRSRVQLWLDVWRCPKPVIAQVHGFCMGVATQLAVCCDLTVVADDAVIGWPSLPLGGGYIAPFSSWLIGPKKAKELSFIVGSRMSGVEAVALGWANRSVPEAELAGATQALARQICKTPPDLLAIKKRAINRVMDMQGFSESVMMGAEFDAIAHGSQGAKTTKAMVAKLGLKEAMRRFKESDSGFEPE